jgi:hypothetical protein
MEKVEVKRTAWVFDSREKERLLILLKLAHKSLVDNVATGEGKDDYIKTADYMIAQLEQADE